MSGSVLAAATTNIPLLPTVTDSLTGFVVIEGGETGAGVGGAGGGGSDGGGAKGATGGIGAIVFTLPPIFAQPDTNNAGKVRSVRRCRIFAQNGRVFGSRGQGCPINKKKSSRSFWSGREELYTRSKRAATRCSINFQKYIFGACGNLRADHPRRRLRHSNLTEILKSSPEIRPTLFQSAADENVWVIARLFIYNSELIPDFRR